MDYLECRRWGVKGKGLDTLDVGSLATHEPET